MTLADREIIIHKICAILSPKIKLNLIIRNQEQLETAFMSVGADIGDIKFPEGEPPMSSEIRVYPKEAPWVKLFGMWRGGGRIATRFDNEYARILCPRRCRRQ